MLGRVFASRIEPVDDRWRAASRVLQRDGGLAGASSTPASWLEMRGSGTPVIARLRPGVSLAQAAAALGSVTPPVRDDGPAPAAVRVAIESMYDDETGPFRATIRTLSMAVALILLIACVNVAGLMLARGATRRRGVGHPGVDRCRARTL